MSETLARVEFEDAELAEVIAYLNLKSVEVDPQGRGVNFVIDPAVNATQKLTLNLNQVTVGSAMACLVDHLGLDYRIETHACFIVPGGMGELAKREPSPPAVTGRYATAVAAREIVFDRVEFAEAPVGDVLRYIANRSAEERPESGGINLVLSNLIDPNMAVTLSLRNVAVSQVLNYLAQATAIEVRVEPYAIFIDPPGTRQLKLAKLDIARRAEMEKWAASREPRPRGKGYSLGSLPNDPRSPVHPDYVSSIHSDVSKRTNSLNNVYKWVGGVWTFVRFGSSGTSSSLSGDDEDKSLRTSSLQPAR